MAVRIQRSTASQSPPPPFNASFLGAFEGCDNGRTLKVLPFFYGINHAIQPIAICAF
jgi:hypothetical protein